MRARTTPLFAVATAAVLGLRRLQRRSHRPSDSAEPAGTWEQVESRAQGQTVSLWMWAAIQGERLRRRRPRPRRGRGRGHPAPVPIADTKDALTRVLAEKQARRTDEEVDLVWVNGDDFATGRQADAWECGWADDLPNARFLAPNDPLVGSDFGTDVAGCESPWRKAQFSLVYDSARVRNRRPP